jgi:glycogen debranching enzyme
MAVKADEKTKLKIKVLSQPEAAVVKSIADALVIKDGKIFFLADKDGYVPLETSHAYGLYFNDCRYLSGYEWFINGSRINTFINTAEHCFKAALAAGNLSLKSKKHKTVKRNNIGIIWERILNNKRLALFDEINLKNFSEDKIELQIEFHFKVLFEDIYVVRGFLDRAWQSRDIRTKESLSRLSYLQQGNDGTNRHLIIQCYPKANKSAPDYYSFNITIGPNETKKIRISLAVFETEGNKRNSPKIGLNWPDIILLEKEILADYESWFMPQTHIVSDNKRLERMIRTSMHDMHQLRTPMNERSYWAAGIPWFAALFGRDSLIATIQTMMFNPSYGKDILLLLASYQGEKIDPWRDEQPGKILHEMRNGELSRNNIIPNRIYYGTVDTTPLFLIVLSEYIKWTGDIGTFIDLRPKVIKALKWINEYGDNDNDGYVDYVSPVNGQLINQGWKDSGNSIVDKEGRIAEPPIALCEVQAYVYLAKTLLAELFEITGDQKYKEQLLSECSELKTRFNKNFWIDTEGVYAMCFANGKRVDVVTSNAGHALWSGIATNEKAKACKFRLMKKDMFSGWGVRTFSENETAYNPVSYHLGSVWPHENIMIAAGMRRYGFDHEASMILNSIFDFILHMRYYRVPELFCGFARDLFPAPVPYPVACQPQAWGAGTSLYMLRTMLGLFPDALHERLDIIRPILPRETDHIEVKNLSVGKAKVDLVFHNDSNVEIKTKGKIKVNLIKNKR